MPTYAKRFEGLALTKKYHDAASRGRQLTNAARPYGNVNPLFAPGAQARMRNQLGADTLQAHNMRLDSEEQARRVAESALRMDTQRQQNAIGLSDENTRRSILGLPALGQPENQQPVGVPQQQVARTPEQVQAGLQRAARPVNKEVAQAGIAYNQMLNNPQASMVDRGMAKAQMIGGSKATLGIPQPQVAQQPPIELPQIGLNFDLQQPQGQQPPAVSRAGTPATPAIGVPTQGANAAPQSGFVPAALPPPPTFTTEPPATRRAIMAQYNETVRGIHKANAEGALNATKEARLQKHEDNWWQAQENALKAKTDTDRQQAETEKWKIMRDIQKENTPESVEATFATPQPNFSKLVPKPDAAKQKAATPQSRADFGANETYLTQVGDNVAATPNFHATEPATGKKAAKQRLSPEGDKFISAMYQIHWKEPGLDEEQLAVRAAKKLNYPSYADPDGKMMKSLSDEAIAATKKKDQPAVDAVTKRYNAMTAYQQRIGDAVNSTTLTPEGQAMFKGKDLTMIVRKAMAKQGLTIDEAIGSLRNEGFIQ